MHSKSRPVLPRKRWAYVLSSSLLISHVATSVVSQSDGFEGNPSSAKSEAAPLRSRLKLPVLRCLTPSQWSLDCEFTHCCVSAGSAPNSGRPRSSTACDAGRISRGPSGSADRSRARAPCDSSHIRSSPIISSRRFASSVAPLSRASATKARATAASFFIACHLEVPLLPPIAGDGVFFFLPWWRISLRIKLWSTTWPFTSYLESVCCGSLARSSRRGDPERAFLTLGSLLIARENLLVATVPRSDRSTSAKAVESRSIAMRHSVGTAASGFEALCACIEVGAP
mmetsp:Transcript_17662/g.56377  ORF Transcript_17662/g.56377 Transcript_17662/m.56377 type:complete len:284 (+) Transcript_17662:1652-2503(+)